MREEVQHAVALLVVSVLAALAILAALAEDTGLIGWTWAIGLILAVFWCAGFAARYGAQAEMRRHAERGVRTFEWSWWRWVIPAGGLLALPLVLASDFPDAWGTAADTLVVFRVVLAYAVVETIRLLALDGEWVKDRMAASAPKMFAAVYRDDEFDRLTGHWLAAFNSAWQGGWGKASRAARAKQLARPYPDEQPSG